MPTPIHFIGGEKGGVGKSLMARVLAQYFIDREMPFLGFDTDRSHGALLRFYPSHSTAAAVDKTDQLDAIVEAAVDQPGRRILVDLAAQTHDPLAGWMEEGGVVDLAEEMDLKLHYWHVMDTGRDSADLLRRVLDRFPSGVQFVLVRNQVRGTDFTALEQSGEQQRALDAGAKVVTVKKLAEPIAQKIDATSASFWKAGSDADGGLGMMDRQRVKAWLRDVYREIDDVAP
jgi:hypothetical protein